jgi:hypothetical protein
VAAALVIGLAAPSPGFAQILSTPRKGSPQTQAAALFKEAQELQKSGNPRGALVKLGEAYQILPTPTLLWPIAELCLQVGQPVEGLEAIQRYRQDMAPAEMEPGQQLADADKLEEKLRMQLGYLRWNAPADATVEVDDKEISKTSPPPDKLPVNPGIHRVIIVGKSGKTETVIHVRPGQEADLIPGEGGTQANGTGADGNNADGAGHSGYFPHPLTWAAIGISAGLLFSATVLGGITISETNALDGTCANRLCVGSSSQDIASLNAQVSTQRTHSIAAAVIVSAASLLSAGTVALIIVDWQRQKAGRRLLSEHRLGPHLSLFSPLPVVHGDGAGFAWGGRF